MTARVVEGEEEQEEEGAGELRDGTCRGGGGGTRGGRGRGGAGARLRC